MNLNINILFGYYLKNSLFIVNGCCPMKFAESVTKNGRSLKEIYILRFKLPQKKAECSDNCIYVKVRRIYFDFYTTNTKTKESEDYV